MDELPLVTVSTVVAELGGRNTVADLCGVSYNAVANWCAWNVFPKRQHLNLSKFYREKLRKELPESLFERAESNVA